MVKRNVIKRLRRTWLFVVLALIGFSLPLYLSLPAAGSQERQGQQQDGPVATLTVLAATRQAIEAQETTVSLLATRDAILAMLTPTPQASPTLVTPTATVALRTNTPTRAPAQTNPSAPTRRLTTPAPAPAVELEVLAAGVNIRSGPGAGFPVIGSAQTGQRFAILGQSGNCAWLKIGQVQNQERWITGNAQFVRLLSPCSQAPAISLQAQTPVTPSTQLTPTPGRTATVQPAPSTRLAGPTPLEPGDGAAFDSGSTIVLRWAPVKSALGADELYFVTITYRNRGAVWTDTAWTQETQWRLNEHGYLLGMSDDSVFNWSVKLLRQSGTDAKGVPQGDDLSLSSPLRSLVWRSAAGTSSGDGGGGADPTPTPGDVGDRPG